jgi:hypothetical protein
MTVSRRGFFGMLAGLAAAPVAAPLAKLFPETAPLTIPWDGWVSYRYKYTMTNPPPKDVVMKFITTPETRIFRCGTGEMGTLYWSKDDKV